MIIHGAIPQIRTKIGKCATLSEKMNYSKMKGSEEIQELAIEVFNQELLMEKYVIDGKKEMMGIEQMRLKKAQTISVDNRPLHIPTGATNRQVQFVRSIGNIVTLYLLQKLHHQSHSNESRMRSVTRLRERPK